MPRSLTAIDCTKFYIGILELNKLTLLCFYASAYLDVHSTPVSCDCLIGFTEKTSGYDDHVGMCCCRVHLSMSN